MSRAQYDITIIGGGSGGLIAARVAASLGAKVLLIDKERLGGDCLQYGCVPSKSLIYAAHIVQQSRKAADAGMLLANVEIDMAGVSAYIQQVIDRVRDSEQADVQGVSVQFGTVSFASPTTLLLNNEPISSRNIIIATGSRPRLPDIAGLHEVGYLTNEDIFDLTALPPSLLIVGGGPVGVELGQALARLGSRITIIQRAERILPREDPEVSETIARALAEEGITIIIGAQATSVSRHGGKKTVTARRGDQQFTVEADEILLASGRQPNVERLNLGGAGVQHTARGIKVNAYLQTSTKHIFAIGDVVGDYFFSHVAAYHASIAVRNALLPIGKKKVDYRVVPWCIFTEPEAAHVGLTPAQAEQRYQQVRLVRLPWSAIDRAQTENAPLGFIKLVLAGKNDRLVGAHLLGAHAGELLGELSLAMRHRHTLNDIFNTIHAYPTLSTGVQQAAFEAYLGSAQAASNRKIIRAVLELRG